MVSGPELVSGISGDADRKAFTRMPRASSTSCSVWCTRISWHGLLSICCAQLCRRTKQVDAQLKRHRPDDESKICCTPRCRMSQGAGRGGGEEGRA